MTTTEKFFNMQKKAQQNPLHPYYEGDKSAMAVLSYFKKTGEPFPKHFLDHPLWKEALSEYTVETMEENDEWGRLVSKQRD